MSYDLLEGVKVVELSMYAFAPSCAAVLADWGADVIKVVPPDAADPMRGTPVAGLPPVDVGVKFIWEQVNRGKRCMTLDVGTPDGRALLDELLDGADVFLTNLLPAARERFGLEPDQVLARQPELIYARASAHGPAGPDAAAGGFDHTAFWARSGIGDAASMTADEFVALPGPAMGDLTAGAFLAGGIAAALFRRTTTGKGTVIDVSLLSAGMWIGSPAVLVSQLYGIPAIPRMRHAELPVPLVAAYTTRDDRLIYLAGVRTDRHFENFCTVVGRLDLLTDPRFATAAARQEHRAEFIGALDEIFAARDLADWIVALRDLTTPWTVVQTAAEAAVDPQVVANHYVVDVEGPQGPFPLVPSPAQFDGRAPALVRAPEHGEHTEEILLELGRSWEQITELKERNVIG